MNTDKSSTMFHKTTTYSHSAIPGISPQNNPSNSFFKPRDNSSFKPRDNSSFKPRDNNYQKEEYLVPLIKLDTLTVQRIQNAKKTASHLSAQGEYKWASDWENYAKQIWGNASKGNFEYILQPSNISNLINENNVVVPLQYTNTGIYKRPHMFQNASI